MDEYSLQKITPRTKATAQSRADLPGPRSAIGEILRVGFAFIRPNAMVTIGACRSEEGADSMRFAHASRSRRSPRYGRPQL
jgi:hypothetical protein